jgi:Mn2+/Fe2+ NRAMP family transporter
VLLPIILILMLKLVNTKRLMGEYTNSRAFNAIAGTTTVVLIVLSFALLYTILAPMLSHSK